jgi:aspartate/methionine/tyrosine aminotransferase
MPFAIPISERAKALLSLTATPEIEPADAAPLSIRLAVEAALDRGETHYTDRPGILCLREKIAALLRERFGIETNAGNDLIVTCGVTEARFVAAQQLLRPGDTLAAPIGGDILFGVALLRRAELADSITAQARLVYLRSSTPENILRSLLASAPETARILFEVEEPEGCFHPAQLHGFENRTVTIGALGAERWRIGYLASPGGPSADLRDFKQALTICSTNLSQWAVLAAMEAA